MVRQKENDVWSSVSFAYIAVNMTSLLKRHPGIIENCILIVKFSYYFMFLKPANAFKKLANCIN
jgi:hypothetical protein